MTPKEKEKLKKELLEKGINISLDLVKGSLPLILETLKDLERGNQVRYFSEENRGSFKVSSSFSIRTLDDLKKKKIDEFTELEEKQDQIEITINKKLDGEKTVVLVKDNTLFINSETYKNKIPLPSQVKSIKTEFSDILTIKLYKL